MVKAGSLIVTLAVLAAACGGSGGEEAADVTQATAGPPATESPGDTPAETQAPATTAPPTPEEEGDGVGHGTLVIGDEMWSFDQVDLCTSSEQPDETNAFVMIIKQDDWQLVGKITDPTGARRQEGDGVFATIDYTFVPDPTQGLWLASGEATGEQFFVIDDLSVTADADFDDLRTTEIEETPGTLDVTCP